jgi:hypothetical protein
MFVGLLEDLASVGDVKRVSSKLAGLPFKNGNYVSEVIAF